MAARSDALGGVPVRSLSCAEEAFVESRVRTLGSRARSGDWRWWGAPSLVL